MSDLVKTLITGFLTSIILLLLVYFFWKLYDRPSKKQLEVEEITREKRKEERMWRAIEADMAREREQIEAQALIQRKQADLRARAQPPAAGVMQTALATLDAPTDGEAYLARFKPDISGIEEILVDENLVSTEADDSDVLLAPDIVEVRIDSLHKKFRADNEYDEHFNALVAHQKETNAVEKDETMEEMKPSKPVSNSATDDLIEVTKQSDSTLDSWDLEW